MDVTSTEQTRTPVKKIGHTHPPRKDGVMTATVMSVVVRHNSDEFGIAVVWQPGFLVATHRMQPCFSSEGPQSSSQNEQSTLVHPLSTRPPSVTVRATMNRLSRDSIGPAAGRGMLGWDYGTTTSFRVRREYRMIHSMLPPL